MPGDRVLQYAALAAHRLGDQEILDLQIIEAGRVELHHLHVGDAAARAPRHRDAVAGRAPGGGRELIDAPRPAAREDRRPPDLGVDLPRRFVERIDAPDAPRPPIPFPLPAGAQADARLYRGPGGVRVGP